MSDTKNLNIIQTKIAIENEVSENIGTGKNDDASTIREKDKKDEEENTKTNDSKAKTKVISHTFTMSELNQRQLPYYACPRSGENNLPMYWVQFNMSGGSRIPEGGGPPMQYEPGRNEFVRVVFSIVLFMLMLTTGWVMFVYMTNAKHMFRHNAFLILIVAGIGMLGLNYAMSCSPCTRQPPCNFICLFLAVCFMSIIASCVTTRYRTEIVLLALAATTVTVLACLALACTRFDFTRFLLYVVVVAIAFAAIASIVAITMLVTGVRYKPLTIIILVVGTIINVIMLIMELQMVLGGGAVELSEDDYALGAFMIYTSIVDVFLKIVQLMGILDNE